MRTFKFRVWDRYKSQWLEGIELVLHCKGIFTNLGPNIELSQWTGLKDKNGVDVYEGDIIRHDWHDIHARWIGFIGEMKFGEYDDSEIEWGSPAIGWYLEHKGNQESPCNLQGKMTIIGNIYENPELLNIEYNA